MTARVMGLKILPYALDALESPPHIMQCVNTVMENNLKTNHTPYIFLRANPPYSVRQVRLERQVVDQNVDQSFGW
jgi:hypothetical protein